MLALEIKEKTQAAPEAGKGGETAFPEPPEGCRPFSSSAVDS